MKQLAFLILVCLGFFGCKDKNPSKLVGRSMFFDGKDDQVILPHYESLNISEGTVEVWFKIDHLKNDSWHSLVSKELAYQITIKNYRIATTTGKQRIYMFLVIA